MRLYPESNCKLYSNIDICDNTQIAFSSKANQAAYFNKHVEATFNDFQIVKKVGIIKLDVSGDVATKCNYLSFMNSNFDNRIFYARILDYDFTSPSCTTIAYAIDYWQTYMFDFSFEDMDIDRQHLSQSLWEKAEANPYDPSIYEFRTPESLAVSKELEDYYQFDNTRSEASYNFRLASSIYGSDGTLNMYLFFVSAIDFDALDEADTDTSLSHLKPSAAWHKLMQNIINANGVYADINGNVIGPYGSAGINVSLLSSMNRPYMIIGIPKASASYCSDVLNYLTAWSAISSIIGVYDVPKYVVLSACEEGDGSILQLPKAPTISDKASFFVSTFKSRITASGYSNYVPKSKKLCLSPYSYIRVITPNNDIKEYRYEDFLDVMSGDSNDCYMRIISDLNAVPSTMIAPYKYKKSVKVIESSESVKYMNNLNKEEIVTFQNFPESPYVTDSYLAAVAGLLNQTVASNTMETRDALTYKGMINDLSLASDITGTLNSAMPSYSESENKKDKSKTQTLTAGMSPLEVIQAGFQLNQSFATYGYEKGQIDAFDARLAEGVALRSNPNVGIDRYKGIKAAYAADVFVAGSKGGCYNMISQLGGTEPCDFIVNSVKLRDEVLKRYDEYFIRYGYKSDDYGVPHVLSFVEGSTDDSKIPHWETIDGKPCTYIKTISARINAPILSAQTFAENLLNTGIRMLKGDDL